MEGIFTALSEISLCGVLTGGTSYEVIIRQIVE